MESRTSERREEREHEQHNRTSVEKKNLEERDRASPTESTAMMMVREAISKGVSGGPIVSNENVLAFARSVNKIDSSLE
ncbi:hypothetical protein Scep_023215 [Stephania cephalantha]|uniref:Uncharacterized protein n=1 Tax=Stephania cephalantha TaxID=152367 RepID=A0AAP0EX16_9MAGN